MTKPTLEQVVAAASEARGRMNEVLETIALRRDVAYAEKVELAAQCVGIISRMTITSKLSRPLGALLLSNFEALLAAFGADETFMQDVCTVADASMQSFIKLRQESPE